MKEIIINPKDLEKDIKELSEEVGFYKRVTKEHDELFIQNREQLTRIENMLTALDSKLTKLLING